MSDSIIKGMVYEKTGETVQGSFVYSSHQLIPVEITANDSSPMLTCAIIIVATDYYRLEINGTATVASMMLAPGMTPLVVTPGDVLSFLRVSPADSQITLITPA